jgi:putative oxidoreductase
MGFVREYGPVIGRILISLLFVVAGLTKAGILPGGGWEGTVGYIAGQGLPMPEVLAALTILLEIVGGLMIMLGFKARLAAIVFFLWLIPVTFIFHNMLSDPSQQTAFLKNLTIMGAMLYVAAYGSGKYSLDKG